MANIIRYIVAMSLLAATVKLSYSDFLKEGLVGHYEFECNTEDSGASGATLIEYGDPECTDNGKLLRGYTFDGEDGLIFPNNTSSPYYSVNGFTWSIWINADSLPTLNSSGIGMPLISFADPRDARDAYLGFGSPYTNRRELTFLVDGAGGAGGSAFLSDGICRYYPQGGFQDSTWIHIVGVRDYENDKVSLYLDGQLVATKAFSVDEPLSDNNPGAIAAYTEGGMPTDFFAGTIDEVRFYERPFTDEEVLKLYSLKPDQLRTDTLSVDFGNLWCEQDTTITIPVYNIGPSNFNITEIRSARGTVFSYTDPSPLTLTYPAGDTLNLNIIFSPNTSGEYIDTIFFENELDFPPLAIELKGSRNMFSIDTIEIGTELICGDSWRYEGSSIFNSLLDGQILTISDITSSYSDIIIENTIGDTLGLQSDELVYSIGISETDLLFEEEIIISFNECPLQKKIVLRGEFVSDSAVTDILVDFDVQAEGTTVDTSVIFTYPALNYFGIDDISIADISIQNSGSQQFEIVPYTDGNLFSAVNDSIIINIINSVVADSSSALLEVRLNTPCGEKVFTANLIVNGQFVAEGSIKPNDIIFEEFGDTQFLMLQISETESIIESGISELFVDLSWNGSMLTVDESVELDVLGDYLVGTTAMINANQLQNGEINLFEVKATLGNTYRSDITVDSVYSIDGYSNFRWSNSTAVINSENIDTLNFRLVKTSGLSTSIVPNPVTDNNLNLQFEHSNTPVMNKILNGNAHYKIRDIVGKIIDEDDLIIAMNGNIYSSNIQLVNLRNGIYSIFIEIDTEYGIMVSASEFVIVGE